MYTIAWSNIESSGSIDLEPKLESVQKVLHLHLGKNIKLERQFGGLDHVHICAALFHTSAGVLNHMGRHGNFGRLIVNVCGHAKSRRGK